MKILIIGGTQFVGRAMAETAIGRGHDVTLFHRGQTNPGLFGDLAEILHGDRKLNLSALAGRHWDAVIDCVGYDPGTVRKSCEEISADSYVFVSTISVYPGPGASEESPTSPLPEGADLTNYTAETYGPLKVLCEQEVTARYKESALILRAGLQVGPHDHTDRFSDWVDRLLHHPTVVVPDDDMRWQIIDTEDMAEFALQSLESGQFGIFNVTGESVPLAETISRVRDTIAPHCELVSIDPGFLRERAKPWQEIALWLPSDMRSTAPLDVSIRRALDAGLRLRKIEDSVAKMSEAIQKLPRDRPRRGGLRVELEQEIVREWQAHRT